MDELNSIKELNIRVRILMPAHKSTEQIVQNLREQQSNVDVRYIEQTSGTQATFLAIDRKASLVVEIRDDSKTTFDDAKRLSRLTDDILDATRIESKSLLLKKDRFNLKYVILNALDDIIMSRDLNGENVRLLYHPQDFLLEADKRRITQVISNLLSNAIKFTEKGTINITTKIDEDKDLITIGVKDTGIGIDPEILPKLFSRFAAKSFSGTGLGLFISKSIVEAHGGEIWAENNASGE